MTEERKLDVIALIETWLKENGFDGLCDDDECGCYIEDICPCGELGNLENCKPAYKHKDGLMCLEKEEEWKE